MFGIDTAEYARLQEWEQRLNRAITATPASRYRAQLESLSANVRDTLAAMDQRYQNRKDEFYANAEY